MRYLAILVLAAVTVAGLWWLRRPRPVESTTEPYGAPSPEAIRRALGAKAVERGTRIRGPVAGDDGQFAVTFDDGHEVGVFAMRYRWKVAEAPVFWVNLESDAGQVVLVPEPGGIRQDKIPSDWLASDYLRERGDRRPLSFIALNPRRGLRGDGKALVAETAFVPEHPMTTNLKGRTTFRTEGDTLRVLSVMVYATGGEAETERVLEALDRAL